MKKFTLLTTILLLSSLLGSVNAKDITFGYCEDYAGGIGWNSILTSRALIEVPKEKAALYQGAKITNVSVALGESGGPDVKIVILKNIDNLKPLYSQDATVKNKEWATVELTTPYTIDGNSFYIGYEMEIKKANYYPIGVDMVSPSDPCGGWVAAYDTQKQIWESMNLSELGFGHNCIRFTIEGENLPDYDMQLQYIEMPEYTSLDKTFAIKGKVRNNGGKEITSYDVSYAINGGEAVATTIEDTLKSGESATFEINPTLPAEIGKYDIEVTISKVDGNADEYTDDNVQSKTTNLIDKLGTRKVLLENFSTTNCGNCPAAHDRLHDALEGRDDVMWVVHHAGFGTDIYTINASQTYTALYGAGGTYAPAVMLDRRNLADQGADVSGDCPVFFPGSNIGTLIDYCLDQVTFVDLTVHNRYNEETRELEVIVTGEKYMECSNNTNLTVFLVEDGLVGYQSGGGSNYNHDHVMRAVLTPVWGESISGAVGTFEKVYTTTLKEAWNPDNMTVIAFVSNYNATNINDRVIHNANNCMVKDMSGVNDITNENNIAVWGSNGYINIVGEYENAEVYTIDGRLVEQANGTQAIDVAAGIYLVRIDGNTTKVMVK